MLQMLNQAFRPHTWLQRCYERYGDVFTVRLPGEGTMVFLSDPGDVKAVFTGDASVLEAGAARHLMEPVFGSHSVLLLDGAEHMRQRRMMLPPFRGERMRRYADTMAEITKRALSDWPVGRSLPLLPRLQAITLEVILRVVFGIDRAEQLGRARKAIQALLAITGSPWTEVFAQLLPRGAWIRRPPIGWLVYARFERAVARVDAVLLEEIETRRGDSRLEDRDDILSLLLAARDDQGNPMTDGELRDELVTLLLAGHETTATTLAWTFDALLHHPDTKEKVLAECAAGDRSDYSEAALKEALRLWPPLPFVDRKLAAPIELGGFRLPAGIIVAPCAYVLHRRADVYPDPAVFRPERFLADQAPDSYTWLPFGGGIRHCLGAHFAMFEMQIVLRTILSALDLRAASPKPERIRRRAIVLAPARGCRVVLDRRVTKLSQ